MGAPLGGASVTVIQGRNYINGEWRDASETFESVNPSDIRETVGVFPA